MMRRAEDRRAIKEKFHICLDFCKKVWYRVVLGKAGDIMKILEELWYGRINPSQRMQPDDKSDSELTEQIVEKEDELAPLLSDEANEILEQMREKQLDLSTANERKAFISGFILITVRKCTKIQAKTSIYGFCAEFLCTLSMRD